MSQKGNLSSRGNLLEVPCLQAQVTFHVPAQISETRTEKPALLCWAAECTALLTANISGMLQASVQLHRLHCGLCSSQAGAVLGADWVEEPCIISWVWNCSALAASGSRTPATLGGQKAEEGQGRKAARRGDFLRLSLLKDAGWSGVLHAPEEQWWHPLPPQDCSPSILHVQGGNNLYNNSLTQIASCSYLALPLRRSNSSPGSLRVPCEGPSRGSLGPPDTLQHHADVGLSSSATRAQVYSSPSEGSFIWHRFILREWWAAVSTLNPSTFHCSSPWPAFSSVVGEQTVCPYGCMEQNVHLYVVMEIPWDTSLCFAGWASSVSRACAEMRLLLKYSIQDFPEHKWNVDLCQIRWGHFICDHLHGSYFLFSSYIAPDYICT